MDTIGLDLHKRESQRCIGHDDDCASFDGALRGAVARGTGPAAHWRALSSPSQASGAHLNGWSVCRQRETLSVSHGSTNAESRAGESLGGKSQNLVVPYSSS